MTGNHRDINWQVTDNIRYNYGEMTPAVFANYNSSAGEG